MDPKNERLFQRRQLPYRSDPRAFVGGGQRDDDGEEALADDATVDQYATPDHQKSLREVIEEQDLPVRTRLVELIKALRSAATNGSGMVLLQGETGSGKSVYSPVAMRAALKLLGRKDRQFMLQPRRDAASGIARATAAVMGEELGEAVGFSTSEAREVRHTTKVGVVTPGIFNRHMMRGDLNNDQVGALILDEIHEGSVEYHLALGLLKKMRTECKAPLTLLTSATLNRERIQEYFGINDQDYLKIEGRTYPVEKKYLSRSQTADQFGERQNYLILAAQEILRICRESTSGDLLVFVPGAKEIRTIMEQLKELPSSVEVLPLHGGLQPEERDRALSGKKSYGVHRRIILATNIAETSVTVPGIRYVVDTGRQRVAVYNPDTGITEKRTEWISKDQAEQRAGRAGRTAEGTCMRIMTEEDFEHFREHPESQIKRENLSHVVLQLVRMGIDPRTFDFIEPPPPNSIDAAFAELQVLGALDEYGEMTPIGEEIGRMPFEPRIGRMLIEAKNRERLLSALVIAGFEREGPIFMGATEKEISREGKELARLRVQGLQKQFSRGGSDIEKNLALFAAAMDHGVVDAMRRDRSPEGRAAEKKFKDWCKEHYVKAEGLMHIAYKLREYAQYTGIQLSRSEMREQLDQVDSHTLGAIALAAHPDRLMVLVSANIGMPEYVLVNDAQSRKSINISPKSDAFNSIPTLCVATDISEGAGTKRGVAITRNYAAGVQPITGKQLREVVPHLIAEHHDPPRYHSKNGRVEQRNFITSKKNDYLVLSEEAIPLTGSEAVEIFAAWLVRDGGTLQAVEHNRRVLATLENLQTRSQGRVKIPNMEQWYRERLQGVSTLQGAEALKEQLQLNVEDYCSAKLQQDIDRYAPIEITIRGQICSITYESNMATISMDPTLAAELNAVVIPTFGFPNQSMQTRVEVYVRGRRIVDGNIEVIQQRIEEARIQDAWEDWNSQRPQAVEDSRPVLPLQSLPTLEEFSARPIQFAVTKSGYALYAFPARFIESQYDDGAQRYTNRCMIRYHKTKQEADDAEAKTQQEKRQIDAAAHSNEERLTIAARAKEKSAALHEALQGDWLRTEGMEGQRYQWEDQFDLAQSLLTGSSWGQSKPTDPQRAMELLIQLEHAISHQQQMLVLRKENLPIARTLYETVASMVDERLRHAAEWGIPRSEENRLTDAFYNAQTEIEHPTTDLGETIRILKMLQRELQRYQRVIQISYTSGNEQPPSGGFSTLAEKLKGVRIKNPSGKT